nr:hypothetical protein [uncultured Sulfurimonas sp.]
MKKNELIIMLTGLSLGICLGFILNHEISQIIEGNKALDSSDEAQIEEILLEDDIVITEKMWNMTQDRISALEGKKIDEITYDDLKQIEVKHEK